MKLNETQICLLEEQYVDRIAPCINEILIKAKTNKAKEICTYLILMAIEGEISETPYELLLGSYLKGEHKWLEERLLSLHKLFKSDNSNHLFIRFIIDPRFYTGTDGCSQSEWRTFCKDYVTKDYYQRIHSQIKALNSDIYEDVLGRLHMLPENLTNASSASVLSEKPKKQTAPSEVRTLEAQDSYASIACAYLKQLSSLFYYYLSKEEGIENTSGIRPR